MSENKCCYEKRKNKHIVRSNWEKCLKCNSTCPAPVKLKSNNVLMPNPIHNSMRMNRSKLLNTNSNNTTSRWSSICVKTYNTKMGIIAPLCVIVKEEAQNDDSDLGGNIETNDNGELMGNNIEYGEYEDTNAIHNPNSIVECSQNTIYNTPYGINEYNPNLNCCNGFKLIPSNKPGQIYKTSGTRGGGLGDISYPRNQGGRWNTSTTNTKLYPVISKYKDSTDCSKVNGSCKTVSPEDKTLKIYKQSGNIFKSTTYNMSKKQQYAYCSKFRGHLYR